MALNPAAPPHEATRSERWPSDPGVWVFLGGDLLIFTALFCAFQIEAGRNPGAFAVGQSQLNMAIGLANTLILLASSWFVVGGLGRHRTQHHGRATGYLLAAILCGLAFCGLKFVEYGEKIATGSLPESSPFFMYYFALTGLHLFHVFVAIAVLGTAALWFRKPPQGRSLVMLEAACLLWHLIDVAWLYIYGIIYLMPIAVPHV